MKIKTINKKQNKRDFYFYYFYNKKMAYYHFGVPGWVIWTLHILIGAFYVYLGYAIVEKKPINKYIGVTLIVIGVLMALYHGHLWYCSLTNCMEKANSSKKSNGSISR